MNGIWATSAGEPNVKYLDLTFIHAITPNQSQELTAGLAINESGLRSPGTGLKERDAYRPLCLTVNVCPAIVIVPERARVVLATE